MVLKIDFKIDHEKLDKELEHLRQWYNDHLFHNKEVLKQDIVRMVVKHLEVILVEDHENL